MGYLFKISLYGVGKSITRFRRLCSITHYSSDNHWRVTAIIVNKENEKVNTRERATEILSDALQSQMGYTNDLYGRGYRDLTRIPCLITCSDIQHPYKYEISEYHANQHARSLLYDMQPTHHEAHERNAARLVEDVVRIIELFYLPATLIRNPTVSWRVDLYYRDYSLRGSDAELSRLMGFVMDSNAYDSIKGLKVYVGRLGDYMVCRSLSALLFVIEQRLKDYLVSTTKKGRPASLPTILYGYTSDSVEDVVGKYRSYRSYDAIHVKTHAMFTIRYIYDDYDKTDVRIFARVLYNGLVRDVLPMYLR